MLNFRGIQGFSVTWGTVGSPSMFLSCGQSVGADARCATPVMCDVFCIKTSVTVLHQNIGDKDGVSQEAQQKYRKAFRSCENPSASRVFRVTRAKAAHICSGPRVRLAIGIN